MGLVTHFGQRGEQGGAACLCGALSMERHGDGAAAERRHGRD